MKTKAPANVSFAQAINDPDLLEELAALEHQQWVKWSKTVARRVDSDTRQRWKQYWVPYAELSEEIKELDRVWARRILRAFTRAVRATTKGQRP